MRLTAQPTCRTPTLERKRKIPCRNFCWRKSCNGSGLSSDKYRNLSERMYVSMWLRCVGIPLLKITSIRKFYRLILAAIMSLPFHLLSALDLVPAFNLIGLSNDLNLWLQAQCQQATPDSGARELLASPRQGITHITPKHHHTRPIHPCRHWTGTPYTCRRNPPCPPRFHSCPPLRPRPCTRPTLATPSTRSQRPYHRTHNCSASSSNSRNGTKRKCGICSTRSTVFAGTTKKNQGPPTPTLDRYASRKSIATCHQPLQARASPCLASFLRIRCDLTSFASVPHKFPSPRAYMQSVRDAAALRRLLQSLAVPPLPPVWWPEHLQARESETRADTHLNHCCL